MIIYQLLIVLGSGDTMTKGKSGITTLSESQRCAQAIALQNDGKTRQEVAKSLGRSVRWVQKWWQRIKHGESLDNRP